MLGFSGKQKISVKESTARINIWEGAVRSGKTFASIFRFILELAEGPPGDYAIICRTFDTFRRNVLELFYTFIGGDARYYKGDRVLVIYGKTVHIIGADDERAEGKLRGATFRGAYVDELTLIPQSVFLQLIARCTMDGARIFATTNPDSPYHWVKQDYLENNANVRSWKFTFEDNPALKKEDKEFAISQYHGVWYKRYIEGLWVQADGAVYDFFDTSIHILKSVPDTVEQFVVGIDYGTTNPCAFVLVGIDRRRFPNIWVAKEYYFDSKVHQRQKTDSEYAEDLKRFIYQLPVAAIYLDPSAVSFRVELRKIGIDNVYEANNDVLPGIRFVSNLLNNGTLKIGQECVNLIKEVQSYSWDTKSAQRGVEKPLKQNDHLLDSLRYCLFSHLPNASKDTPNAQEWDRLYWETRQQGPNLPPFFRDDHQRF